MSPLCIPFLFCCIQDAQDSWVSSLHSVLQQEQRRINIPEEFRQALLSDDDVNNDFSLFGPSLKNDAYSDATFLLKGLPERPLYVELGYRLYLLHQNVKSPIQRPFLLPAEHFGFDELPDVILSPLLPRYGTKRSIREWINTVGTRGILRILGMRHTIGSDPRNVLPPSWKSLLEAASSQKHALSVAARARAKHAHRGKDQFFGVVGGNAETQNIEAHQIVLSLLRDAAWINIHTFGGKTLPFLEVRVASGYGARWKIESTELDASKVSFRGFLEPQMPDGHERNWRH